MQTIQKFQHSRYIAVFTAALVVGIVFGFGASVWATSLGTNLTVSGDGTVSGTLAVTGATTLTANIVVNSTTATSTLSTGGLNIGVGQFVVQGGTGRVGIGTPDPRQVLTVIGNGLFSLDLFINGNDINLGDGRSTTTISGAGVGIGVGSTTPGAAFGVATGTAGVNTAFLVSNAGTGYTAWFEDAANDATPFIINAAGSVGVGSSSPQKKFSIGAQGEVGGGIYLDGGIGVATSTTGAGIAVATSTVGQNTALLVANYGSGHTIWAEDAANDATPFVLDATGRVGVGTTTPSQEISAVGDIYLQSAATTSLILNTTGTGGGCIEFHGTQGTKFFLIATSATYAVFQTGSCQ